MVIVYIGSSIALGFCPGFKSVGKIFLAIQDDFQGPVYFDVGKSFGHFLKGIEKGKAANIQSFEHDHIDCPSCWSVLNGFSVALCNEKMNHCRKIKIKNLLTCD